MTAFCADHILVRKMQLPLAVGLVERESGAGVRGEVQIAVEEHLLMWTSWRYRSQDEDRTWDWWGIFQECKTSGGQMECFAAFAGGNLQGLMSLDFKAKGNKTGEGIIVDYLATSPANRTAGLGLKYVGIGLIAAAIKESIERGCGGRISLESLPGAANFYEGLGMVKQPRRSAEGHLVFTLEAATAEQLLDEINRQGILKI